MERNKRSNKYQSIYFFPTIIILLLGVVIFFGIRERVEGALATQYEALFARLEEEFAIKAAYDSITFHSINIVQLRDVFLEWQGNSVVAESIALRINPLSFRAQNPLGVIRAINLNKLHMTLDLDRLTEFNDVVSDGTSESESVVDIDATLHDIGDLFRHATISITNTSLIMKSGAMNYGVDNINVAIDFSEDLLRYEGECIAHIYSAQPVTLPLFLWESDTRMRVMLAGDYVFDRAYSESTIMLADIEAGGFALQPLEFQLRYQNKSIALNSATPLQPLQIALTYDVEEQLLVSDVVSLGVNYDQLIVEGRSAIQIPDILRNYYTFSFSVEYNASADILSYRADLNATRQAKDVLTLNMQGDRTQLFVNNAVLFAPVGQAMLRGGVDLLQRTMEGSLQFDQFAIMDSNLINGTFEIRAADESITDIVSTNFIIGDIALPLIRATAQLLPTLNAFDALIAFDREQNEIASFAFNNNIAAQTDEYTASFVDVSLRDLVKIGKNIAPQQLMSVSDALVEDLYLNASANIYREAGDVLISLPLLSVLNRPSSFEILSMRAAGTSKIVDVEEIVIHARDMSLQGFASMKNIADQTYDVNIVLAGARERYDLDVRYRHRQFARLTSSRGVSAVLLFLPNERLRYIMEFSSFPLYIGNIEFALDLASQGDFQSAEIWNFNVDTLDLVEIASSSGTRRRATANGNDAATYAFGHRIPYSLNASFGATPQGVSFQEFVVQDNTASFEGNGGLSFMSEEECREAAYGVVLASA